MRRHTPAPNKRARPLLCLRVSGSILPEAGMGCVTPSQYPEVPAGSLGRRSSSSLLTLPGEWQGGGGGGHAVMRRKEWRREAIDPRPIVEMEQYPHLPQWPRRQAEYNTHTHAQMYTHATQPRKLLSRAVLSPAITLLPL